MVPIFRNYPWNGTDVNVDSLEIFASETMLDPKNSVFSMTVSNEPSMSS